MRNERKGKLEPKFEPTECEVINIEGTQHTVRSENGQTYKRNQSMLKRVPEQEETDEHSNIQEESQQTDTQNNVLNNDISRKSTRERTYPSNLKDLFLYSKETSKLS